VAAAPRAARVRVWPARPLAVPLDAITIPAAREIDGELIRLTPDSILLSVTRVLDVTGGEHTAQGETARLLLRDVSVEVRRLSTSRTLLAAGGLLAATLITGAAAVEAGSGSAGGGSGHAR
jgi:hypothetical protein